MARYPNESCMKICFISWIIISCAFASTSAYFAYRNQITIPLQGVSNYVYGWLNTWLSATSWTCLFCGILGPTVITMAFLIEVQAAACILGTILLCLFCIPSIVLYSHVHFNLRPMVTHAYQIRNETIPAAITNETAQNILHGMNQSLEHYIIIHENTSSPGPAAIAWDEVQRKYDCCGVHSLHDWQDVFVDLRKAETGDEKPYDEWAKGIPVSCCRRGFKEGKMMFRELCQGIRTEGCYPHVLSEIEDVIVRMELRSLIGLSLMACWGAISFSLSFCWLCVTITAEIPNARKRKLPPDLWEPATTPPMNRTVLAPKSYPMAHSDTELAHEPLRVSRMRIDDGAQWAEA